eukprot:1356838-Prymnesium_polylepis.1
MLMGETTTTTCARHAVLQNHCKRRYRCGNAQKAGNRDALDTRAPTTRRAQHDTNMNMNDAPVCTALTSDQSATAGENKRTRVLGTRSDRESGAAGRLADRPRPGRLTRPNCLVKKTAAGSA